MYFYQVKWLRKYDNIILQCLYQLRSGIELGINSASLCSLAGRYDNPIPTRFLSIIYSLFKNSSTVCVRSTCVAVPVPGGSGRRTVAIPAVLHPQPSLSGRPVWRPSGPPGGRSCRTASDPSAAAGEPRQLPWHSRRFSQGKREQLVEQKSRCPHYFWDEKKKCAQLA